MTVMPSSALPAIAGGTIRRTHRSPAARGDFGRDRRPRDAGLYTGRPLLPDDGAQRRSQRTLGESARIGPEQSRPVGGDTRRDAEERFGQPVQGWRPCPGPRCR